MNESQVPTGSGPGSTDQRSARRALTVPARRIGSPGPGGSARWMAPGAGAVDLGGGAGHRPRRGGRHRGGRHRGARGDGAGHGRVTTRDTAAGGPGTAPRSPAACSTVVMAAPNDDRRADGSQTTPRTTGSLSRLVNAPPPTSPDPAAPAAPPGGGRPGAVRSAGIGPGRRSGGWISGMAEPPMLVRCCRPNPLARGSFRLRSARMVLTSRDPPNVTHRTGGGSRNRRSSWCHGSVGDSRCGRTVPARVDAVHGGLPRINPRPAQPSGCRRCQPRPWPGAPPGRRAARPPRRHGRSMPGRGITRVAGVPEGPHGRVLHPRGYAEKCCTMNGAGSGV